MPPAGCGGPVTPDGSAALDATNDTGRVDAPLTETSPDPDVATDAGPDLDTGRIDAATDTTTDIAIDTTTDVAIDTTTDVAIDVAIDTATDSPPDVAMDTTTDVAIALDATVGADANDTATRILGGAPPPSFVASLDSSSFAENGSGSSPNISAPNRTMPRARE